MRAAASFVARRPDEVATRSLRAVAAAAELPPATFSRLAKALGFEGYEALREVCREQMRRQRVSFAEKARALQEGADASPERGAFVARQGAAVVAQIEGLLASVEPRTLEAMADRLAAARYVRCFGALSSRPFAEYLAYMGAMAFENWRALDMAERAMAAGLTGMDGRDALVVVSLAPSARRAILLAEEARGRGIGVLAITDDPLSALAVRSDLAVAAPTEGPNFFSSYGATLVLIETLMAMAVARGGAAAQERIAAVEAASHRVGDYWDEG